MGKYMRKCRGAAGEEVAAVEVTQVVGVRTRSRSASAATAPAVKGGVAKVAPKRRKALRPATATTGDSATVGAGGDGGSCYLQLRSRMLFKVPPSDSRAPKPAEDAGAGQCAVLATVLSRCSSTASSLKVSAKERSAACRSDAAEAGGDHIPEGSASNSGSGRDRDRRETTPSSLAHGESSDLESDLMGQKSGRSLTAATLAVQPRRPPAAEIEEFFAAAEEAQAKSFASKYNFDVVRSVPLDAGRFKWTPVVSISSQRACGDATRS
ncbi:cyclin-dependent kinase inhibitor 1-like [Phragmites australis]|uniref:cyclin-dependent kinase inhibitor 1-like n=1 Tax=Phragmites australis TaxID=29695 RepID=UPI002D790D33|nr:cyclin-dependent kinase inhibitor 1-like [Phragmites australis]